MNPSVLDSVAPYFGDEDSEAHRTGVNGFLGSKNNKKPQNNAAFVFHSMLVQFSDQT
jgi:hypothetical protein